MRRILGVVIVAACGSKAPPPEPLSSSVPPPIAPAAPPLIVSLTSAREAMCACTNAACAHAALAKLRAWSNVHPASDERDPAMSKQIGELFTAYGTCLIAANAKVPAHVTWPPHCDVYEYRIHEMARCTTLPEATRNALWKSVEETTKTSADTPERMAALDEACKGAADAVRESSTACE